MSQLRFGGGSPVQRLVMFALNWAILAAAVWAAANLVSGIRVEGWQSIAVVALIIGLLNALLRPLLFTLAFPVTLLTLGLFRLVLSAAINAALLWVADAIAAENARLLFSLDAFLWDAVLGGVIISLVAWALNMVLGPARSAGRML
ncbi:MAG: phage holin family protein [Chloroflexi bacterium]|nr:phage holin family protein [Chloroflexota bacterium]MDA1002086.1 phage holin family protein [Chloroflexota bacterium]